MYSWGLGSALQVPPESTEQKLVVDAESAKSANTNFEGITV